MKKTRICICILSRFVTPNWRELLKSLFNGDKCLLKLHGLSWWRHQIETFSTLLVLCAGNSPVTGEFPTHRPVTRNFDVFVDLRLNQRLSKQLKRPWFVTPLHSLWLHCNDTMAISSHGILLVPLEYSGHVKEPCLSWGKANMYLIFMALKWYCLIPELRL